MSGIERVAVGGAGAFGTALALVAAKAGRRATLWARDCARAAAIRAAGENAAHLPGIAIPTSIAVTADQDAFHDADLVLLAVPAQATRTAATALAADIPPGVPVVACAKGIEQGTGLLQTEIIAACLPHARPAALSGPGFAEEIARGLPTAVTIAARDIELAHRLCAALSSESFRPYASDDLIGVEIGGAIKNILAIACGIVAGRQLGEGARAALIARGMAEMMRLGAALGARPATFMGLSGLGDLVLTATSAHSRNTAFGTALGKGASVKDLLEAGRPLAEGAHSAQIAAELARRHGVDAPIIAAVAAIIAGALTVDEAIAGLINRPLKVESD
jgi:glycerol-3-phosphate dehydrogenase (NAD(P)+)